MDKRSILIDALAYLKSIHEETEMLQEELKQQEQRPRLCDLRESSQDNPSGSLRIPRSSASIAHSIQRTVITEVLYFISSKLKDYQFQFIDLSRSFYRLTRRKWRTRGL